MDVRDQLDRSQPGDAVYARAHERLSAFAVSAQAKCDELRSKLETAEAFALELQDNLRRRRKAAARP